MIRRGTTACEGVRARPLRVSKLGLWFLLTAACGPVKPVPIFLWHSVGEGSPNDRYDLTVEEFEEQLQILDAQNIKTVSLDQILDDWEGKVPLPYPKAVCLTFDDGRQGLYDNVLPALMRHHATAEVFLVINYLAESADQRRLIKDAMGQHPYLTWDEVGKMLASGAFLVESHTLDHPPLKRLSQRKQHQQIVSSRRELQRRLGVPAKYFAYPFGSFNHFSMQLADQAGYRAALSVTKGNDSRFQLTRTSIQRGSTAKFREVLSNTFGRAPAL